MPLKKLIHNMAVVIGALRLVSNQYGRCQLVSSGASWCRLLESLFWFRSLITGLFLSFVCFRPRQRLLDIGSAWHGHSPLVGAWWGWYGQNLRCPCGCRIEYSAWSGGFSYIFLTRDRKKKIKCDSAPGNLVILWFTFFFLCLLPTHISRGFFW